MEMDVKCESKNCKYVLYICNGLVAVWKRRQKKNKKKFSAKAKAEAKRTK